MHFLCALVSTTVFIPTILSTVRHLSTPKRCIPVRLWEQGQKRSKEATTHEFMSSLRE
jgi:hypothetical protein